MQGLKRLGREVAEQIVSPRGSEETAGELELQGRIRNVLNWP